MTLFNGGPGPDNFTGTPGDDQLYGYDGDDILFGGDGSDTDTLVGGFGNDTLIGSTGKDLFFFNDNESNLIIYKDAYQRYHVFSSEGHDIITNFSEAEGDTIIVPVSPTPNPEPALTKGVPMPPTKSVLISSIKTITLGSTTLESKLNSADWMLDSKSLQNLLHSNQSILGADTVLSGL